MLGGDGSRGRGDRSAGGGQSNSLDAVRSGLGDAAATRSTVGALDVERVGVLEDAGVALEAENKTVDGLVTKRSVDVPGVSVGTVLDTSCICVS